MEGDWIEFNSRIIKLCSTLFIAIRHMDWTRFFESEVNGKIYVCGEENSNETTTISTEVYGPASNEWSFSATMNLQRSRHALALVDKTVIHIYPRWRLMMFKECWKKSLAHIRTTPRTDICYELLYKPQLNIKILFFYLIKLRWNVTSPCINFESKVYILFFIVNM